MSNNKTDNKAKPNNYIDKCFACGYIYEQGFNEAGDWVTLKGNASFLCVKTKDGTMLCDGRDVTVIACPKCGTLKLNNVESIVEDM